MSDVLGCDEGLEGVLSSREEVSFQSAKDRMTVDLLQHICSTLADQHCVQRLNLAWCNIDDEGAAILARMLRSNRSLVAINLRGNNITDEGANALAEAIHGNSVIQQLNIFSNPCSVLGASSIKAACRSNRQRMLLNENVPLAEQNAALKLLKPWRSEPLPTDLLPPSPSVDVEASCSSSRPPWEVSTPSRGGSVPLGAADPVIPSPKEQLRARANSSEEEHFAQALEWIRNPGLGRDGEKHVILSRVFMNEERVGKLQEALSQSSSGVSHLDFSRCGIQNSTFNMLVEVLVAHSHSIREVGKDGTASSGSGSMRHSDGALLPLRGINLQHNPISIEAEPSVLQLIESVDSLSRVELNGTRLQPLFLKDIRRLLSSRRRQAEPVALHSLRGAGRSSSIASLSKEKEKSPELSTKSRVKTNRRLTRSPSEKASRGQQSNAPTAARHEPLRRRSNGTASSSASSAASSSSSSTSASTAAAAAALASKHKALMQELIEKLEEHNAVFEDCGFEFPDRWLCPITFEVMVDPAVIEDGMTYERAAIEIWLETHDTSPLTNMALSTKIMFPNHVLRGEIQEARKQLQEGT